MTAIGTEFAQRVERDRDRAKYDTVKILPGKC
jgi:hypothetical protein